MLLTFGVLVPQQTLTVNLFDIKNSKICLMRLSCRQTCGIKVTVKKFKQNALIKFYLKRMYSWDQIYLKVHSKG